MLENMSLREHNRNVFTMDLDNAIILEFKVREADSEKTHEDTVESALDQIIEKKYDAELLALGITQERIRHYGFAFEGKKVLIG